jgi:hypothetical protein
MLVQPGDVEGLAGVLARLIGDGELRQRLGRGGPARAREISLPAARIAEVERALSELKGSGRRTA